MAFWGVEVKPGKPVIHSCEKAKGRLRISQATLGISDATKKSIVQCNVGKKSPVLLCALLPNHTESCHLDLEFEEADDVVFSVIGPRSVYLTGYYVRQSQQSNPHSDSESYGVDIEDTQTEESSYHSDDDIYEDSFIDDDETQEFSPSPILSSKVMDETASENDDLKNGKGQGRRLKKKCQVVESDKDASSHESEDEDGFLLSVFKSKRDVKTTLTGAEANNINQNLSTSNGNEQMNSLDLANPKKKRKECTKEENTCELQIDKDHSVLKEDKEHDIEPSKTLEIGDPHLVPPPESSSGNCKKSKKRRIEQFEGTSAEAIGVKTHNVAKDDKFEQDLLHANSVKKDLPAANGNQEQQIDNASQPEKKIKKKMKKKKNQGEESRGLPNMTDNQETSPVKSEDQTTSEKPMQNRTLSNGLVIEELTNGPPDGKVASRGKKVTKILLMDGILALKVCMLATRGGLSSLHLWVLETMEWERMSHQTHGLCMTLNWLVSINDHNFFSSAASPLNLFLRMPLLERAEDRSSRLMNGDRKLKILLELYLTRSDFVASFIDFPFGVCVHKFTQNARVLVEYSLGHTKKFRSACVTVSFP